MCFSVKTSLLFLLFFFASKNIAKHGCRNSRGILQVDRFSQKCGVCGSYVVLIFCFCISLCVAAWFFARRRGGPLLLTHNFCAQAWCAAPFWGGKVPFCELKSAILCAGVVLFADYPSPQPSHAPPWGWTNHPWEHHRLVFYDVYLRHFRNTC